MSVSEQWQPVKSGKGYATRPVKSGDVFGRLTAIEFTRVRNGNPAWICKCQCGNTKTVVEFHLRKGLVKSCKCWSRDFGRIQGKRGAKHGKTHSRVWETWRHMRERCESTDHKSWSNYGGRGIAVCLAWDDFAAFYRDMGDPPSSTSTLDRIDSNGDYCKENCRWIHYAAQARNRSSNRLITLFGETKCIAAWVEDDRCTVSAGVIASRLAAGWSDTEAVTRPVLKRSEWGTGGRHVKGIANAG